MNYVRLAQKREGRGSWQSLCLPLVFLVFWAMGNAYNWWPNSIIATPRAVARAFGRLLQSGELLHHTFASLGRLVEGSGIGLVSGIFVASCVGIFPSVERVFRPTLDFLAPIPVLAWIPILIVAFGVDGAKVSLIAMGTGLIMYATTLTAIRDTRTEYIEVARLFHKREIDVLLRVSLPAGAWTLFGGLRTALALSWVLLLAVCGKR
jgi:sulfonate transport system permease protein